MLNLYVDSADRAVAEPLLRSGCFAGLTTNPTLLASVGTTRAGLGDIVGWASDAGAGSVFLQAWGGTADTLVERGIELRALGDSVVVKVPATRDGLVATARLETEGCPVLVTAVHAATQALPAAAADASYVAPYLGRINDAGRDGLGEITRMESALRAVGATTRVLVASVRQPSDVLALACAGVQDFTMAPAVWEQFFADPLTAAATDAFELAAATVI